MTENQAQYGRTIMPKACSLLDHEIERNRMMVRDYERLQGEWLKAIEANRALAEKLAELRDAVMMFLDGAREPEREAELRRLVG